MRSALAWWIFGIVWALALIGTLLKIFSNPSGTKLWSIGLYLAMGWLIIFVSGKLFATISATAITFLALGGAFYTIGVLFYVKKNWMYSHAIWHGFVLLGTVMHFFSILFACVVGI
jgi:hemolysin III